MSRQKTFATASGCLLAVMAAAGAPSPLYVVYQQRFGFSAAILTIIFAIYTVALLAALLTVGSISDHIGRKPVLVASLLVETASMVIFLAATSVTWLLAARLVQGLATGAAVGALSAVLLDTQPPGTRLGSLINSVAPGAGLGIGALGAGMALQWAPNPTRTLFLLLIALFVVLIGALLLVPETASRRSGALRSLRPRIRVPEPVRGAFMAAMPTLIATWAVGGLFLSLGASIAVTVFGLHGHLLAATVIVLLVGMGAITSFILRDGESGATMRTGTTSLIVGIAIVLVSLANASAWVFFVGTVIAGVGFGAGFSGAFRTVALLIGSEDRAGVMAGVFTVSYLAFGLPAVIGGIAVGTFGLRDTVIGYSAIVLLLCATSLITTARPHRQPSAFSMLTSPPVRAKRNAR